MGVPSKKLKIAENSLPKIRPRKSTTRAEPMVKKKLQPDFGSFSYSIRTDEIKIKNVPTQKLLFREKYFKEQLKNYTYLIVKQKAKAKSKSKKQKQKAKSKSKKQKQKAKAND